MGANTKIEWATHTFNPWRGCTKVSEGCKNCYADAQAKRNPKILGVWGPQGTRVLASESMWAQPLKWNAEAQAAGVRPRVFCASMADVFEGQDTCSPDAYTVIREGRRRLFDLIAKTPNLDWLLLTKRPENWERAMAEVCQDDRYEENHLQGALLCGKWLHGVPPANVWMGTSVENQLVADTRIPELLKVPAAVRFLSCEPLLSEVMIYRYLCDECDQCERSMPRNIGGCFDPSTGDDDCDGGRTVLPKIDWVIGGGESGPHARPVHHWWAEYLKRQCQNARVPFFWKQWGEWIPLVELDYDTRGEIYPLRDGTRVVGVGKGYGQECWRLGKDTTGRLIFGREYSEIPTVEATNV